MDKVLVQGILLHLPRYQIQMASLQTLVYCLHLRYLQSLGKKQHGYNNLLYLKMAMLVNIHHNVILTHYLANVDPLCASLVPSVWQGNACEQDLQEIFCLNADFQI